MLTLRGNENVHVIERISPAPSLAPIWEPQPPTRDIEIRTLCGRTVVIACQSLPELRPTCETCIAELERDPVRKRELEGAADFGAPTVPNWKRAEPALA